MAKKDMSRDGSSSWIDDPNNPRNNPLDLFLKVDLETVNSAATGALPIRATLRYPERSAFITQENNGVGNVNYWNYLEFQYAESKYTGTEGSEPYRYDQASSDGNWTQQGFTTLDLISPVNTTDNVIQDFTVSKEAWIKVQDTEFQGGPFDTDKTAKPGWATKVYARIRAVCVMEWTQDVADDWINPDTITNVVLAQSDWSDVAEKIILVTNDPTNKTNPFDTTNGDSAQTSELPAKNVNINLLRVNLPLISTATAKSGSMTGRGSVKWRTGIIHTWEDTPADGAFPDRIPYGMRFHYNPASWNQAVSFTEQINADALATSQMDRLPLPGGFASIEFNIMLNRIEDLAKVADLYQPVTTIKSSTTPLSTGQSSTPPDAGTIRELATKMANDYTTKRNDIGVPRSVAGFIANGDRVEHIERIIRQGTLYDLDFLYASANGRALGSFHVHGPNLTNPSYVGNHWLPSDYGYIAPRFVRVWLGPYITFVGRINSITVNHILFTQYMVPTLTRVGITITRGLTFGKDLTDAKDKFNTNSSALGISNSSTENNSTGTGGTGT